VRVLHESEMPSLQTREHHFKHDEKVCVIKCTGDHHKELLHEILDHLSDSHLDVLHAEMNKDPVTGEEVHHIYICPEEKPDASETAALDQQQRQDLSTTIDQMYEAHGLKKHTVVVTSLSGSKPPSVPPSPKILAFEDIKAPTPAGQPGSGRLAGRRPSQGPISPQSMSPAKSLGESVGSPGGGFSRRSATSPKVPVTEAGAVGDQLDEGGFNLIDMTFRLGKSGVDVLGGAVAGIAEVLTPKGEASPAGQRPTLAPKGKSSANPAPIDSPKGSFRGRGV